MALAYSKARSSGSGKSGSSKSKSKAYSSDDLVKFAKDLLNEKDNRGGRLSKSYYVNDASGVSNILQQYLGIDADTAAKAVTVAQKDSKNKTDNSYTYRKPR